MLTKLPIIPLGLHRISNTQQATYFEHVFYNEWYYKTGT